MNLQDISTQLLFTTVPIWTENAQGGTSSATAFLYNVAVPSKPEQSIPLLITNHHVVSGAKRGLVEFVERSGKEPDRSRRVRIELDAATLASRTSAELDLAVIPIGPALNQLEAAGRPAFFRSVSPDLIQTAEARDQLAALEEVVFIGYPSGIRDEKNASPLIRRGITSTPVWNDYEGKPTFLIDAGVFPGSSGSPVFILNQGGFATKDGLVLGNRLLFLGVISQTFLRKGVANETFLGLGQVVRSDALVEFLDKVIKPLLPNGGGA